MSVIENNKNWLNFIKAYELLPELWDTKRASYKNRTKKKSAYEKLRKVYKKNIDKNATLETVKKRINNMRSVYRRELKKKTKSEKRGTPYEPNLWYFYNFEFLKQFEMPEDDSLSSEDEDVSVSSIKGGKRKKLSQSLDRNELLRKATMYIDHLNQRRERDEADIYGESWVHSYRKLSPEQKLYAKKAIDEIFILGQLGELTLNSVATEMPQYSNPLKMDSNYNTE